MMSVALVLGGAECLMDDLGAARRVLGTLPRVVVAVNHAGATYPGRIDHWVTLHPAKFRIWERRRTGPGTYTRWSWKRGHPLVDERLGHWGKGSSGLYAVTVARHLGVERIVLCGVPMDGQGNVDGRKEWEQKEYELHREGWMYHLERIAPFVRSMSGWTRDLLGEPTEEWLHNGGNHLQQRRSCRAA